MSEESPPSPWAFIPFDDYEIPGAFSPTHLRGRLTSLWRRIRHRKSDGEATSHAALMAPSSLALETAVPDADWSGTVAALERALAPALNGSNGVHAVIAPPVGGMSEIAEAWAASRGWHVARPVDFESILGGRNDWIDPLLEQPEAGLLVPRLDAFYLRHHAGLKGLECLLERLTTADRPCLLVCGSLSWLYLSRTLKLERMIRKPLALQALGAQALRWWLWELAGGTAGTTVFREVENRKLVLPPDDPRRPAEAGADTDERSDFVDELAAYSRGVPSVARALWRRALGSDPGPDGRTADTLWVPPWSEYQVPGFHGTPDPDDLLVLHGLLLHVGLPVAALSEVVPLSDGDIVRSLQRMQSGGLVQSDAGTWSVCDAAYPAARGYLGDAGFPVGIF